MTWYAVPYSYVTSPDSYLTLYAGRVNQREMWGYKPGQLRYESFRARRYTPTVPPQRTGDFGGPYAFYKLCDISLMFRYSRAEATAPPTPSNPSHVVDGFNAPPWLKNKKFYYMVAKSLTEAEQIPIHLSFAAELLFSDPDV